VEKDHANILEAKAIEFFVPEDDTIELIIGP
jgi:hypothetical protein